MRYRFQWAKPHGKIFAIMPLISSQNGLVVARNTTYIGKTASPSVEPFALVVRYETRIGSLPASCRYKHARN